MGIESRDLSEYRRQTKLEKEIEDSKDDKVYYMAFQIGEFRKKGLPVGLLERELDTEISAMMAATENILTYDRIKYKL